MCENKKVAILIPAYKPDKRLNKLVNELANKGYEHIVVVDDGGGQEFFPIFHELEGKAIVLTHETNRGKGAALKTGIRYILQHIDLPIVTADADGQHTPNDIDRIAEELIKYPDELILGSRNKSQMPPRSRIGNTLTCFIFAVASRKWINDTQTGLRGLPVSMLSMFTELEGDRYEYEMNMLMEVCKEKRPVRETIIETIYINNNETSHFNPIKDGLRIYALIFKKFGKYMCSSLLAAFVDYLAFVILRILVPPFLSLAVLGARAISSLLNYAVNQSVVFKTKKKNSFARYYMLVALIAVLSYLGIRILSSIGMNEMIAKILMDITLFIMSYKVQDRFVFGK